MTQSAFSTPRDGPRAFIFDLDGTLIDSWSDIAMALNAARADLGLPSINVNQVRSWVGDGLLTLCRRSAPEFDEKALSRLVEHARQHYFCNPVVDTTVYPNILPLLNLLHSRGALLAVLSNKPHDLTLEIIARLELAPFFSVVRGSRSEEDRKPNPGSLLEIAALLNVAPAEVYLIGDSMVDIETARHAGAKSVAVTWGSQDQVKLAAARPDFLVFDPLEIASLP
jgi:phosphoglycolate phosphatase